MELSNLAFVALMAVVVLATPAHAQLVGREIDLNEPQGKLGYEQTKWLVVEGKPPGPGGPERPDGGPPLPSQGEDPYGKPEDQVVGALEDPSEVTPSNEQKPSSNGTAPQGGSEEPQDPGGAEDFEPGGDSSERFGEK